MVRNDSASNDKKKMLNESNPEEGIGSLKWLEEKFGRDVVFIPVPKGKKAPISSGYTNFTIEKMREAGYRSQLEKGNIAILVGPNSGDLISIDFDEEVEFPEFAKLNPEICKTLQTVGARGRNLWFRMNGEYSPQVVKLKNQNGAPAGEWRGGGGITIVHGVHPRGMSYQIDDAFPVKEISQEDIVWPENWAAFPGKCDPFDIIRERYGPPTLTGASGAVQLNESFIVGWISSEVEIFYAKDLKQFLRYSAEEGIWERVTKQEVNALISHYIARLASESNLASLHLKKRGSVIGSIFSQLEAETISSLSSLVPRNDWHRIAAANMVIAVLEPSERGRSATFIPLNLYSSQFYMIGKSEVCFEEGAGCPRFLEKLLRPVLDPDDVLLLQKIYGLILVGRNFLQKILLLEGAADLGKGVVTRVLDSVLGRSLVTELRTEHLASRFEISRYLGKRLLSGRDVPSDFLKSPGSSRLKALTGGDTLSSEFKNSNEFQDLKGDFHVVITSNSPLLVRVDDDSSAWGRRLMIIPFHAPEGVPEKRVVNFEEVLLKEEGPGILNWMLEGATLALTEIFEDGTITLSPTQQTRVNNRVKLSDTVDFFVEAGLVLAPGQSTGSRQMLEAYQQFCSMKEISSESDRVFQTRVKNLIENRFGGEVSYSENISSTSSDKHKRGYRGVALARG